MKKITFLFFVIFLLCLNFIKAQTTILIYSEDFETGAPGVTLNTSGVGNNSGTNMWIINDEYDGTPIYPNTPDQNQTSGGTIAFAPYSNYLHIYDSGNGISSCNYDPTATSERFVQLSSGTNGFCTLGMINVKIAFFYIGMGSGTAHAELYYSADNGPWIQTVTIYNNQPIWQYVVVQNPAFDNKVNLRFGFRWVNNAGSLPGNTSIGIDDIFIKGDFENFVTTNFNIVIDSVKPNPICQNFDLSIYYHLTAPICGAGFFEIELSDASGSFSNPTSLVIWMASNQWMNGVLSATIPSNTPAGTCYKVRIHYYFAYYALDFNSNASICFEVQQCPNTITTLQPVVTVDPDSVCVGSVIDVPFWSTGVFLSNNNYIAELSDSNGNFLSPPPLNILGTSPDPNTYDPALVPSPGSVSGLINENNQPIPDGCNYYIRVRSTNPPTIGLPWGPFCIKHCDIETNHTLDIQACLHSCAVGPDGFDTTVYVDIHMFDALNNTDTSAIYDPANNQFLLEVLSSNPMTPLAVVNTGGLGHITASNDTTLKIHVPCADSLYFLGLQPGLYYLRIIATNSNHPYDINGTLIRLLIGAPADNLWIWQDPPDSVLCVGDAVFFYPIPYNAYPPMNSTYQWWLNGSFWSSDPAIGILFMGTGTFNLTVQETNYGCKGPVTPNSVSLDVLGTPNVSISGPNNVCLGDTIHYQVPFQTGVYYEWSTSGGVMIDTSNNELDIRFDVEGVYTINILALNKCGQATGTKNITVTLHPDAQFSFTTPVCTGANSVIISTGISTPPLTYSWNFDGGLGVPGGNNPGPHNVSWNTAGIYTVILTVTKYGCATLDSNVVDVLQSPIPDFNFYNQCLGSPCVFTDSSQGNPNSWLWNFGDGNSDSSQSNPAHQYADTGSYLVQLIVSSANGCTDTLVKNLIIYQVPTSVFTTKTPICAGENSLIIYEGNASPTATYTWDFSGGTIISGEGQGPYEISWPGLGTYNIVLSVSEDSCNSNTTDPVIMHDCIIIVPNVFTPNGDGENDVFHIMGLESFPNSKLQIYNRWGNKIYESDDYKNNWNGENSPDGVYYYVLTLQNGTSSNGTVTILR